MSQNSLILLLALGVLIIGFARRFPRFSLSRPVALFITLAGLSLGGFLAFVTLPVELFPNASFGVITITTPVRGGMSPFEIERQVSRPIENAVSGVAHLRSLLSNSKKDRSVVSLEFAPGTDMEFATLDVREKFSRIKGKLPKEIETPIIAHYRESDVPVFIFALMSETKTPETLRTLVNQRLKDRLLRLKGVANVEIAGGRDRKIIIDVHRKSLAAHGLDIRKIVGQISKANVTVQTGAIETKATESAIRTVGQYDSIDDIAETIIGFSAQGTALRVKDVATIKDSFLERDTISRLNTKSAVTVYIQKEAGANTVRVVNDVKSLLLPFREALDSSIEFMEVSNQADSILEAIASVRNALLVGMALVILILGFFLGFRPAIVVAISIPLVVLVVGGVFYAAKMSINVMTLMGLALAIGLLVDNSIVVLESVYSERESRTSVLKATESVIPALIGGTLTTVIVFLPVVLFSKKIQILYGGVATTITAALFLSLFVALTTVPALLMRWKKREQHAEGGVALSRRFVASLQAVYARSLPRFLHRAGWVLGGAIFLLLGSIYIFNFRIEKNLSSGEEQNEFVIFAELPSGKKMEIADRITKEIEEKVRAHPATATDIKTVTARIEGWSAKIYVALKAKKNRQRSTADVIEELRPVVSDIGKKEEAFVYFSAPVGGQEITVNVYGFAESKTVDYALQVGALMGKHPNLTDTKIRYRPGRPEVLIRVDPQRAFLFGLNPAEVGQLLHAQTRGLRATYFREKNKEVETIVRLEKSPRETVDALKTLLIPTPRGSQVPLAQVADFEYTLAPSEIWRRNKERMIQVTANLSGKSLEAVAADIKRLLSEIPFTTDYWAEIGGDYRDRIQAQRDFKNAFLMTCLLIFSVLACLFESLGLPLLIFVSVPLSFIGITGALYLTGTPLTMGGIMGILMTGGIAVNHSILFMNTFMEEKKKQRDALGASLQQPSIDRGPLNSSFLDDRSGESTAGSKTALSVLLLNSGQKRLRPILITTLTTCLGLLPMAFDQSENSHLWSPMAIATIGGLLSSMGLTLTVLPALLALLYRTGSPSLSAWKKPKIVVSSLRRPIARLKKTFVASGFFVMITLLCTLSLQGALSETGLPSWVKGVVEKRINDLLARGRRLERDEKFSSAIDLYLEAVRLSPGNEKARRALLRANRSGLKKRDAWIKKERRRLVREASDRRNAKRAFTQALDGKMKTAHREAHRKHWIRAFDLYERILEADSTYSPARDSLRSLVSEIKERLEKGGGFSTDPEKEVAQGFVYFYDGLWADAYKAWAPSLQEENSARRWGTVRLGEYAALAFRHHQDQQRQEKVEAELRAGVSLFREGRLKEAHGHFQSVLQLSPSHALALEYVKIIPGMIEQAREDVLIDVEKQQIAQSLSDAMEFLLKGYYDEAEAKIKVILETHPNHKQARSLADEIRQARGLSPLPTPEVLAINQQMKIDQLFSDGIVFFADGRYQEARKSWEKILKIEPRYERATQALKKLDQEETPHEENKNEITH